VIRGTAVHDQDGARQATLLFPAGTTAQLALAGGATIPLSTLTVRATEYTLGSTGRRAMPAPLPPTTGYTYAVELSADEALDSGGTVEFSQPLAFYLENFLNFPVGGIVPAGYYDRAKATWNASDNGLVVKILSVAGGVAELDISGAGAPASAAALAALGITADERQSLATLYPVGQSLWRVPVRHFSSWDWNWPFEPPLDATEPPNPDADPPPDLADPCDQPGASTISCENQALGEDVPIVGTPLSLHYHGDRVPGRRDARRVHINLSGPSVPASLLRIDLSVSIAGRLFVQSFAPAANLSSTFEWDGVDAYGRQLQGMQLATVTVAYAYPSPFAPPARGVPMAFGRFADGGTSFFNAARNEVSLVKTFTKPIGLMDATVEKLGGWMLNVHHVYDTGARTLWRGDGSRDDADPVATRSIDSLAVTSLAPRSVRLAADGSVDVVSADFGASEIDHVDRNGGVQGAYSGAGESLFVYGAARDKSGQLFFLTCDAGVTEIRRVVGFFYSTVAFSLPQVVCLTATDFVSDEAGGFFLAATYTHSIFDVVENSALHVGSDGSVATLVDSQVVPQFAAGSVALAPDGSLYVGDWFGGRLFRLDPTGALTVVAGTGTRGFSGDGGPAVFAQLEGPVGITAASDGSVWLTDGGRLRRIDSSGFILSMAGGGGSSPDVGVSPFDVAFASGVGIDPNGVLYFAGGGQSVWRIADPFPGYSTNGFLVASSDAGEAYELSADGRHLRTLDPVTGAVLYRFTYNASNLLIGIQDRDGRLTQIERDATGNATAIVSPDGQRTTLTMGTDGTLQAVTDPAAETRSFTYAPGGVLATQRDPRGFQSTYQYTDGGRLVSDADAAGGFKNLARVASPGLSAVTISTAAGNTSQYAVQYPASGGRLRLFTGPDGATALSQIAPNGQRTATQPDGTVVTTTLGADPRFGLQAPVVASELTRMPSGLTMTTSSSRSATLAVRGDPMSLSMLTETWTQNGKSFTSIFDRSQMRWTSQTPTGRQSTTTVSSVGRPTSFQLGTLAAVQFTYDSAGRITAETWGSGTTQRTTSLTYGTDGRLRSLTDPLQRTFSMLWDAAGRLTSQTLPDGRIVSLTYDANGNLTSVTPPARPAHKFSFTPVNLALTYTPPDLGNGPTATTYSYDLDRRLTAMTRPDGRTVLFGYQQDRLSSVNFDRGTIRLSYDPTTALLQTVSDPGGETLAYAFDGPLPTRTSWSGPVAGTFERSFNQDFRVSSQALNGQVPTVFQYDGDGLLIQAGSLSVSRDPGTGLVTGTSLGSLTTAQLQSGFGEVSSFSAAYAGSELFRNDFSRDAGGRITRKVETILGTSSTYDYSYDVAGRLTDVRQGGTPLSHYDYDANSNRVSTLEGSMTTTAAYDLQDRLLQWGDMTYASNASGDLASKTQNGSTVTYAYDALGSLTTLVDASGIRTDYLVDGQNRRVGTRVNGVLVQGFLWQDQLKVAAELDGGGSIVSSFVYATSENVPDYMVKNGVSYRLLADPLGSPRLVVDSSSGQVAQRLDYDAWGRVTLDTNPGFQPFGFAGGLYDSRTGLVRFGRRDYDAAVGRWTSKDPVGFAGGDTNLYGYVVADPVNLADPAGLATYECKKPLKTLGPWGGTRRTGPDVPGNPLYHGWLCVKRGKVVLCGEQNHADNRSPLGAPGKDLGPPFDRKLCRQIEPDSSCLEDCLKRQFAAPRPWYNFLGIGGASCQDWEDDVLDSCRNGCILAGGG
jgi:RHS repeat-associated protein